MRAKTLILTLIMASCTLDEPPEEDEEVSDASESTAAPTHDPTGSNCPGGSGGRPRGQPPRKECYPTQPDTICLDCCMYNYDVVDGWKCRKHKPNSPTWDNCWARAILDLADCQVHTCNRHGKPTRATGAEQGLL